MEYKALLIENDILKNKNLELLIQLKEVRMKNHRYKYQLNSIISDYEHAVFSVLSG